jgi:hypothetical protein
MEVYTDALSLAASGVHEVREKKRSIGYGKNKTTVVDRFEVAGLKGLTPAGFYGERGWGSHINRRDFTPNPLNAVVVLHDPYVENNPDSPTLIILTNAAVDYPLKIYDGSAIENGLFREAKQSWFIERPARNTERAFRTHAYLTILTMALTTAFRTWMDVQGERESEGEDTGIRKFRGKVHQENGNKFIIFDDDRYAIFEAYEMFILCGRKVLKPGGFRRPSPKRIFSANTESSRSSRFIILP